MHIAKFHGSGFAFVVLGHCSTFDDIILEIKLFEMELDIKVPRAITLNIVDKGKFADMTIIKFALDKLPTRKPRRREPDWLPLDKDAVELLKPRHK